MSQLRLILESLENCVSDIRALLVETPQVTSADELLKETSALEASVAALREVVERENSFHRWRRYLKDIAPALVASLALLVSGLNFWFAFVRLKPEIVVVEGSSIFVSYTAAGRELDLTFKLTLANYGNKMDVVRRVQGELQVPDNSAFRPIVVSSESGNFSFTTETGTLALPFTLKEKSAVDLKTAISRPMGSEVAAGFLDQRSFMGGVRHHLLTVDFTTADARHAAQRLCFLLSKENLDQLSGGKAFEITLSKC